MTVIAPLEIDQAIKLGWQDQLLTPRSLLKFFRPKEAHTSVEAYKYALFLLLFLRYTSYVTHNAYNSAA